MTKETFYMNRNWLQRIIFWGALFCALNSLSAKQYPINLSFLYPISLNQSTDDEVNFNWGFLLSKYGTLKGFDFTAFASITHKNVYGAQFSNFLSMNLGDLKGAQFSNCMNINKRNITGAQIAGLVSISGGKIFGSQLAALMNLGWGHFSGCQVSGLFNISFNSNEEFNTEKIESMLKGKKLKNEFLKYFFGKKESVNKGAQVSGIANLTFGHIKGVQMSGLLNFTLGSIKGAQFGTINLLRNKITGIQIGFLNISDHVKGLQMGYFSFTEKFQGVNFSTFNLVREFSGFQMGAVNMVKHYKKGVQIGLVNIVEQHDGIPIGLILLSQNARIYKILWGSNISGLNTGLKFNVNHVYSIVYIGRMNIEENISESLSRGFFYGCEWNLSRFYVSMDLGYTYIDNYKIFSNKKNSDQNFILSRITLGFKAAKYFSLFCGGGYGYLSKTSDELKGGERKIHIFGGIQIN